MSFFLRAPNSTRVSFFALVFAAFLRTDDAFILRFLRARKFNVYEAFRLYARYFEYRQHNQNLFKKFHAAETHIKNALLDGFPGVLNQTDQYGRKVLVLFSANWNNERYGLASIYRAILLTLEKLISEEETQVHGFVIIVDWSQFSFKQSTWINPKILKLIIEGLQVRACVCVCACVYVCVSMCPCA